jgi:hypothetical protein
MHSLPSTTTTPPPQCEHSSTRNKESS